MDVAATRHSEQIQSILTRVDAIDACGRVQHLMFEPRAVLPPDLRELVSGLVDETLALTAGEPNPRPLARARIHGIYARHIIRNATNDDRAEEHTPQGDAETILTILGF